MNNKSLSLIGQQNSIRACTSECIMGFFLYAILRGIKRVVDPKATWNKSTMLTHNDKSCVKVSCNCHNPKQTLKHVSVTLAPAAAAWAAAGREVMYTSSSESVSDASPCTTIWYLLDITAQEQVLRLAFNANTTCSPIWTAVGLLLACTFTQQRVYL